MVQRNLLILAVGCTAIAFGNAGPSKAASASTEAAFPTWSALRVDAITGQAGPANDILKLAKNFQPSHVLLAQAGSEGGPGNSGNAGGGSGDGPGNSGNAGGGSGGGPGNSGNAGGGSGDGPGNSGNAGGGSGDGDGSGSPDGSGSDGDAGSGSSESGSGGDGGGGGGGTTGSGGASGGSGDSGAGQGSTGSTGGSSGNSGGSGGNSTGSSGGSSSGSGSSEDNGAAPGPGDTGATPESGGAASPAAPAPAPDSASTPGSAPSPAQAAPPAAPAVVDPLTVGSISGGGDAALPSTIAPSRTPGGSFLYPGRQALQAVARPLPFAPGTPREFVAACRKAIIAAARPHGVIHVDAASMGRMQQRGNGEWVAPLEVRIVYARQGGSELKQAHVACHLNDSGNVVLLQ